MRKQHPFILNLDEGDGAITLSAEEHEAYLAYIGLMHQAEDMERLQIYFRGHTDAVAYLKKTKRSDDKQGSRLFRPAALFSPLL